MNVIHKITVKSFKSNLKVSSSKRYCNVVLTEKNKRIIPYQTKT